MPAKPIVSIIIPCYKQAHLLSEAISSAIEQTVSNRLEIVVVDDGSPDNTAEVAAKFGPRVEYIRKENAGLPAARNTGILGSSGEFLLFLDSDDYLPPDAVERHLETMTANSADVAYCDYNHVDESGRLIKKFQAFVPEIDPFHQYLLGNMYPPHAGIVRRSALANCGLFDPSLKSFEDWDLWIRLALAGAKFAKTPGLAVSYRQHAESMSRNLLRMRECGMRVLQKAQGYHINCSMCRRSLRAGRWGLRNHFIAMVKDGRIPRAKIFLAACGDPLLLLAPVRESLRSAKWRMTPTGT